MSCEDLVHLQLNEVKLSEVMTFLPHEREVEFDDRDPQITGCSES